MDRFFSREDVRTGPPSTWVPVPAPQPLQVVIRSAILNALAFTDGSHVKAAGHLGISPRAISYLCRRHGIPSDHKPWAPIPGLGGRRVSTPVARRKKGRR